MFTGIIQKVGKFQRKIKEHNNYKLIINVDNFLEDVSIGDSIAVNGICLTVVKINSDFFTVDVMPETVRFTNIENFKKGDRINLEKALRPNNFMGGHIVNGHIDGTGELKKISKKGNSRILEIEVGRDITKYLVDKGSIALNGISLTILDFTKNSFRVSIIPETWESTNLKYINPKNKIN